MVRITFAFVLAVCAPMVSGSWTLDNDASTLSFVSVKAGDLAEVHTFKTLAGTVDEQGRVAITIQLASVDTLIPIRDERMREMLFKTGLFPTATMTAELDVDSIESMAPGATSHASVELVLDLHGRSVPLSADVLVARLGSESVVVATRQPVVLNAASVDLVGGIEALREVANLPSISKAVPVSAVLTFSRR